MMKKSAVEGNLEGDFWDRLDPLLARYFREHFHSPTESQRKAFQALEKGRDVLVVSPTGSGKTFTAFMTVLDRLIKEAREGKLQPKTYCVYVSPLKALGNDIRKNLTEPLQSVYRYAEEEGTELQEIRVSIRTGDTLLSERQRHLRRPPHILITTPESLVLMLSSSHREYLKGVKYVIVDELHSLMPNKRGTMLSVTLEWLERIAEERPLRIGLSATISRPRMALRFLLGYSGSRWKFGEIIEGGIEKQYSFEVRYTPSWNDLLREIGDVINSHKVTIIFTGARREAEEISYYLKGMGFTDLYPHHGSLSREVREEVETLLKRGELKAVVTSTSLELGIDIGEVDVVVQVSSPVAPSTLLQRVGRAGHRLGGVSKGIIMARTPHELLEISAIVEMASRGEIEDFSIPEEPWDVAIQMITGMAIGGISELKDIYNVLRSAYPFRRVKFSRLKAIVEDLASLSTLSPSLINRFELTDGRRVTVKRGFHHIFYTNVGTIVPDIKYSVYTSSPSKKVGELSGEFVERLSRYDVFMLGGKTYQLLETRGRRVIVREVEGLLALAPRWTGEVPSRPKDVAETLSEVLIWLKKSIEKVLANGGEGGERWQPLLEKIRRRFYLTEEAAQQMFHYILSLYNHNAIPTAGRVIYERVGGPHRGSFAIYHPSTLPAMRALSHILRFVYRRNFGYLARTSASDDGVLLTLPGGLPSPLEIMAKEEYVVEVLKEGLREEEAYSIRLRDVLFRSQFLLKSYRGRNVGPRKIMRDFQILKALIDSGALKEVGRALKEEAEKEVLSRTYDLQSARSFIEGVREVLLEIAEAVPPSPLLKEVFSFVTEETAVEEITPRVKRRGPDTAEGGVDADIVKGLLESFLKSVKSGDPPAPINLPLSLLKGSAGLQRDVEMLVRELKDAGKMPQALPLEDSLLILPPGLEDIWMQAFRGAEVKPDMAKEMGFVLATPGKRGRVEITEVREALRRAILWYSSRLSLLKDSVLGTLLPIDIKELSDAVSELEESGELYIMELPGGERAYVLPPERGRAFRGAISLKELNMYRFCRAERGIETLNDYVERFWGFHSPYEVFCRLPGMTPPRLVELLKAEEFLPIVWGSLTVYTHRGKLGKVIALRGPPSLGPLHRRALRILQMRRISNHWELGRHLKLLSKRAEDILTFLQEAGLVTRPDAFYRELTAKRGQLKPTLLFTNTGGRVLEEDDQEDVAREALLEILGNLGPLGEKEISSLLGMDSGRVRVLLHSLIRENKVEVAMVEGGGVFPVYGPPGWREEFERFKPQQECRAYVGTDPLLRTYHTSHPRGYGEFSISVVKGGEVVGHLNVDVMADGIHIKSLDIYDLSLTEEVVEALQTPLKYLEMNFHFIVTLQKALGLEGDEIYPPLKRNLKSIGFKLYGKTWARGPVAGEISEELLRLEVPSILRRQRLLKPYHVRSPLELLLIWGNIRDDWEVLSRLGSVYFEAAHPPSAIAALETAGNRLIQAARLMVDKPQEALSIITSPSPEVKYTGRPRVFYTLKELAREHGLLKGYFFPGYQAWGTIHHALLYRSVFGEEPDEEGLAILGLFRKGKTLSLQEVKARSTLPSQRVKDVLEELMREGHLYRDSYGHFLRLPEESIPRKGAIRALLLNELLHITPFRMERLKGYLGPSVNSYAIRDSLKLYSQLGVLRPYVGERGILWVGENDETPPSNGQIVIISPRDRLFGYFRSDVKALFGDDYLYPVFRDEELVAAVKMKKKGSEITDVKVLGSGRVSLGEVMARMRDYMFRV
ncbi:MAG: DEAD/DEAH box helicase [Thermoplasmata archaeon]|nr:DEAD/DEAH box helicase [Thermoplasmata archaeon]